MEAVRRRIEAQPAETTTADGESAGPRIEILHVADANHNVQVDNPLGFVDAVMATCGGGKGAHGRTYGAQYYREGARRGRYDGA